jgi:hypothetical protein
MVEQFCCLKLAMPRDRIERFSLSFGRERILDIGLTDKSED